jgi:hypothetical protein
MSRQDSLSEVRQCTVGDATVMASRTFDEMDDFFDFGQLEQDHSTQTPTGLEEQLVDPLNVQDDVLCMDWSTDGLTPVPATEASLSSDQLMHDVPDSVEYWANTQWPLANIPHRSLSRTDTCLDPSAIVHLEDTIASKHTGNVTFFSSTAPSSSLLVSSPQELVNSRVGTLDAIGVTRAPSMLAHAEPTWEVNGSPDLKKDLVDHRARPTLPSRQNSLINWKPASAKRKGPQSRIPLEARQILEDEFVANPYPCSWEMDIIAHQANLDVKKVRNWFNNTRARKKGGGKCFVTLYPANHADLFADVDSAQRVHVDGVGLLSEARLSKDSLEALEQETDEDIQPPQPLAVYLAQSYQEEAVEYPDVQAAIETSTLGGRSESSGDNWSGAHRNRTGSVVTSVASSDGTAPTSFTISSNGSHSNISSFGRDRRRGRRRMAWKDSPHNRPKYNGVNNAGEPQKDLPFFCTFCPRAFKSKYEWVRHEDSVHALRTTWICCDTKSAFLQSCPFCGQMNPDDAHMAGHKYPQCFSKPESQRTFYRRDHFIQHLHHVHFANTKHPSVRVGCQARLMATEGHHFGCKDLAMRWRRFGAPMRRDDPMLHCGMCGKKSKDWSERCEHVAGHLISREFDRSVWWSERKENHLENLYSASPFESFRCRYCLKIFTDVKEMNAHSHCKVWSCRFLKSFDDVTANHAGPPVCSDFPSAKAHHCHLCGTNYRTPQSEHAHSCHRYRSCNQEFYTSEEAFLGHLHNAHGASHPAILQGSSVIEQNFLRNKGASFEPVEFNESWQPCLMDLDDAPLEFALDKTPPTLGNDRKEQRHPQKPTPVRKNVREEMRRSSVAMAKPQRQRSDTTASKTEAHSPRFFRLSTYAPFLSSRILYSRNSKLSGLPKDEQAIVEEMQKPHVASLIMSASLVGMAAGRWLVKPKQHLPAGLVELALEEGD